MASVDTSSRQLNRNSEVNLVEMTYEGLSLMPIFHCGKAETAYIFPKNFCCLKHRDPALQSPKVCDGNRDPQVRSLPRSKSIALGLTLLVAGYSCHYPTVLQVTFQRSPDFAARKGPAIPVICFNPSLSRPAPPPAYCSSGTQ